MDLLKLINRFWGDMFPDHILFLSTYKLERSRKYPLAPVVKFNAWTDDLNMHKRNLRRLAAIEGRKLHNEGVMARFRESQKKKPEPPKGS